MDDAEVSARILEACAAVRAIQVRLADAVAARDAAFAAAVRAGWTPYRVQKMSGMSQGGVRQALTRAARRRTN